MVHFLLKAVIWPSACAAMPEQIKLEVNDLTCPTYRGCLRDSEKATYCLYKAMTLTPSEFTRKFPSLLQRISQSPPKQVVSFHILTCNLPGLGLVLYF